MFPDIAGWIGTTLILFAYLLISTNKVTGTSKLYQIMNIFGSIGLIVNTHVQRAIPSMTLNIIWVLIGVYVLTKVLIKNKLNKY